MDSQVSHLIDICSSHTYLTFVGCHTHLTFVGVKLIWYLWLSHLFDICDCHTYMIFVTVTLTWYLWLSHLFDIVDVTLIWYFGYYHYFTLVCLSHLFENWSCNTYIQMNLASWFILNVSYIQRLNFSVSYLYMTLASDVSYLKMSPTCRCLLPADVSYL